MFLVPSRRSLGLLVAATCLLLRAGAARAAAPPVGTALSGPTKNQVSLTWGPNGNPGGTIYEVNWFASGGPTIVFSTSSTAATVYDLPGGQTVFFAVRTANGDGSFTAFDQTVSTVVPTVQGQPSMSSATVLGVSSITWTWFASEGAVNYQLFTASGGAVSPLLPATQFNFTEAGLSTNTAHFNYITAFSATVSTTSAPLTRYTLAAPTTGLTLLELDPVNATERLSWQANTNPAGTRYDVLWWSNVTSTVTVSTTNTNIQLTGLLAGGTLYFTVQAVNGDGIASNFDQTYFTVIPSTFFAQAGQNIAAGGASELSFLLPTAAVTLKIASATFASAISLSAIAPAPAAVPAAGVELAALGTPIVIQITATSGGVPIQPARPVSISVAYQPAAIGAIDPDRLVIARHDTVHGVWVPLATFKNGPTLTAFTDHFSLFGVFAATPVGDLSSISVGPNPLRPMERLGGLMTFRNLPAQARLRILTYAGEKVADFVADNSGIAAWNGRNMRGSFVASGVYLVLVQSSGNTRILRVAVER